MSARGIGTLKGMANPVGIGTASRRSPRPTEAGAAESDFLAGRALRDDEMPFIGRGARGVPGRGALGAGAVSDEVLATGFGTLAGSAAGFRQRRKAASSTTIQQRGGGSLGGGSLNSISVGFST